MNSKAILGILLALNLVLGGVVAWFWRGQGGDGRSAVAIASKPASGSPPATSTDSADDAVGESTEFTFRRLLSADLRKYIANLRMVNCPELTVQDVILAEVHRRYASREAALGVHRQHQNPWDARPAGGGRDWKKWARLRELREEKRAVVKDLLGIDIPLDMPNWANDPDAALERALAGIPEDKRGPARDLLERYREKRREIEERAGGVFLPEDAEEYRKAVADRRKAMEALLGVDAFVKFDMETSQTGRSLRARFGDFEFAGNEERGLFLSQRAVDELQLPGQVVGQADEQVAAFGRDQTLAVQRASQELQDLRASMSPARQAAFDRAQDPDYRRTSRQAAAAGLPPEMGVQAYEVSRSLRGEMMSILQSPTGDPQQRQQALQEFIGNAEQQARQSLGSGTLDQFGGLGRLLGIDRLSVDPTIRQLQQRLGILRNP